MKVVEGWTRFGGEICEQLEGILKVNQETGLEIRLEEM
jgi:hypothetical protein